LPANPLARGRNSLYLGIWQGHGERANALAPGKQQRANGQLHVAVRRPTTGAYRANWQHTTQGAAPIVRHGRSGWLGRHFPLRNAV